MIFLDGLCRSVRCAFGRHLELSHKVPHRLGKYRLIVLHRQKVISTAIPNGLGDVGLRSHRIDGDDTALEGQCREEFRNRRLLVRFLRRRALPEDQSCTGRKGADQMQRRGIDFA